MIILNRQKNQAQNPRVFQMNPVLLALTTEKGAHLVVCRDSCLEDLEP